MSNRPRPECCVPALPAPPAGGFKLPQREAMPRNACRWRGEPGHLGPVSVPGEGGGGSAWIQDQGVIYWFEGGWGVPEIQDSWVPPGSGGRSNCG